MVIDLEQTVDIIKSQETPYSFQGERPDEMRIAIAWQLVNLRVNTLEFCNLVESYNYDSKTVQICKKCGGSVKNISVGSVMRKIRNAWGTDITICNYCAPKYLNQTVITRVCELALETNFDVNTRPLKINKTDYPEFFSQLKSEQTSLELDAIENNSEITDRKLLILEIDGVQHFREKPGLLRNVERTIQADNIKNTLVPIMYPNHAFVRIPLSDDSPLQQNLEITYQKLQEAGINIHREKWINAIKNIGDVNNNYRVRTIKNVAASGATFRNISPAIIDQKTKLELVCKNGSKWDAHASVFQRGPAGCPCHLCANRRPTFDSEIDTIAAAAGVKVLKTQDCYRAYDEVEVSCIKCGNELKEKILIRKIREKSVIKSHFDCRYCNIKAAIPAILAYLNYQSKDKLTEKKAKARVINEFGVNPSSLFQSIRNDYRDDKLTQECRSLLEMTFPGLLEKKKQGNRFSDEQLVAFLEKLYGKKPLNAQESLQSEVSTIKRFRKKKAEGKLDPKLEARLLAIRINLAPEKVFTTQERLEQLVEFVNTQRRLPFQSEFDVKRQRGDADAGLYYWQRDMYFKLRHGKLVDTELAEKLIEIRESINDKH